ncbi:MAG TPA: S8 family serine peptidase [Anaerolineae bacterium]
MAISSFTSYAERASASSNHVSTIGGIDVEDLETVSVVVTFDESASAQSFDQTLEFISGGQIIHRYRQIFNGASLVLSGDKIDQVAGLAGITGVYLDEIQSLDTENSPGFIGAPVVWNALGGQQSAGEGTVFASLDSGIWPEHPSFSDPDPLGNSYPAPSITGLPCEFGNTDWNPEDTPFICNNKLIGAYAFIDTYKAVIELLPEEFDSARDDKGHGTHTASTAAGNAGVPASILGSNLGTVSGIAPRAYVIAYKVCGNQGCFSSDVMAAVEQAILDGVDVINYSIDGGTDPYSNIVSLAFLKAYENGIFVARSAGNSGPGADTVGGREPWVTTVAASTQNRTFRGTLHLAAGGNELDLEGISVTGGHTGEVVLAADFGDALCLNPFAAGTWTHDEIVVCERGTVARVAKSYNVAQGGAGGMVLYNPVAQSLDPDNHFVPSLHIQNDVGTALLDFIAEHAGMTVTGTIEGALATASQGDVMADFSSRGGSGQTSGISKPDITAPGVEILAGHTPLPATIAGGAPSQLFEILAGTSMSASHVAGSALLLKDLHPDWTPGQIKSALMTTADPDVTKEDGIMPADPFDYGSGRLDLTKAASPGLTISASASEFINHENDLWNSNYPSIYIPVMPGIIIVNRRVQSELSRESVWRISSDSPPDLRISTPHLIRVHAQGNETFPIAIDARAVPIGEVRHATLLLQHGDYLVRIPISIVRQQPAMTLDKTCTPDILNEGETTNCTITVTNTGIDEVSVKVGDILPRPLQLVDGSLVGATQVKHRLLFFQGALFGAKSAGVVVEQGSSPFGYLSLASLGVPPLGDIGDETIVNFSVDPFIYGGETYTTIGMVSNGYAVIGGGTRADISFVPQSLPDPVPPNNVVAPFWTDLDGSAGGNFYAAALSDGTSSWVVFEWENVPEFSSSDACTFQIWIETNSSEQGISMVYGRVDGDGDPIGLTVGAENASGTLGDEFDTIPTPSDEIAVVSLPGTAGGTHTIVFTALGRDEGDWTNCAYMISDSFAGISTSCIDGVVTALKGQPVVGPPGSEPHQ